MEKSHERADPPAAAESSSSWDPTAPGSDHFHSSSSSQEEEGEEGEELQLFFFSLYLAAQSGGCCSESISGPVQQRLGRIKPGSVHTLHFNLLQTIISLVGVGLLTKAEGCGHPPTPTHPLFFLFCFEESNGFQMLRVRASTGRSHQRSSDRSTQKCTESRR